MKSALPEFVHCEHFMRSITVMKEGLEKYGDEPMSEEKDQYRHIQERAKAQDYAVSLANPPKRIWQTKAIFIFF